MSLLPTNLWKSSVKAMPRSVVQVIPYDGEGRIMAMHRTDKVRSARLCWSFPSGEHEIGETIAACAKRELLEEYNLNAVDCEVLGVYENIAGDNDATEQYHWLIVVVACRVVSFDDVQNNEPEKHDEFKVLDSTELLTSDFLNIYKFHPTFSAWIEENVKAILDATCPI